MYDVDGIAPTIPTCSGGGTQPKVLDKQIVRMVGRNPDNPKSRKPGLPTEQRLEPKEDGVCGALTNVQKDNLVMETVNIKQATKDGYIECELGGIADLSYPTSKTRRGRIIDRGNTCPTLQTDGDVCRIEKGEPMEK